MRWLIGRGEEFYRMALILIVPQAEHRQTAHKSAQSVSIGALGLRSLDLAAAIGKPNIHQHQIGLSNAAEARDANLRIAPIALPIGDKLRLLRRRHRQQRTPGFPQDALGGAPSSSSPVLSAWI